MVATDAYYEPVIVNYAPCPFCGGRDGGCCVCDHFGCLHKNHPLFEAELIDPPDWKDWVDMSPDNP